MEYLTCIVSFSQKCKSSQTTQFCYGMEWVKNDFYMCVCVVILFHFVVVVILGGFKRQFIRPLTQVILLHKFPYKRN